MPCHLRSQENILSNPVSYVHGFNLWQPYSAKKKKLVLHCWYCPSKLTDRLYSFKAMIHIYWCGKYPYPYHVESQDINTSCYGVFLSTYICLSTLSAFIMCLSTKVISHHSSQPLPFRVDAGYGNIMLPGSVCKYLLMEILYRQLLRLLLVFLCI